MDRHFMVILFDNTTRVIKANTYAIARAIATRNFNSYRGLYEIGKGGYLIGYNPED